MTRESFIGFTSKESIRKNRGTGEMLRQELRHCLLQRKCTMSKKFLQEKTQKFEQTTRDN